MKTRTLILRSLRIAVASTCLVAAVSLAFVAVTTTNVLNNSSNDATKQHVRINQSAIDGIESRAEMGKGAFLQAEDEAHPDLGPATASAEEYFKRAYPAEDQGIPISAQQKAIQDVYTFVANAFATPTPASTSTPVPTATPRATTPPPTITPRPGHTPKPVHTPKPKKSPKGGKKAAVLAVAAPPPAAPATTPPVILQLSPPEPTPTPYPVWAQAGPSTATDPAILTFGGQDYMTSGRITALAVDPACAPGNCRLWVGAAGGGVWRTPDALANPPLSWTFVTQNVQSNAIGALTFDAAHNTLYAGTGEPNASGDSASGAGIWRSLDGGDHWVPLGASVGPITTFSPGTGTNGTYFGNAFLGRSIGSIVVDPTNPSIIYASSARGVRGVAAVTGGATSNPPPPRPPFGLFKSVDGGAHFKFIWDGGSTCPTFCDGSSSDASLRGVTDVRLDPNDHNIVYASAYPSPFGSGGGIWRSTDAGVTWTQIFFPVNPADNAWRSGFDVVSLGGGNTRMYVQDGGSGAPFSHVFRSNNVNTAATFADMTAAEFPAGQSTNVCTGQCWYDNPVVALGPAFPDIAFIGGSYNYSECGGKSDCRAVISTTDGGVSWRDFTWDANLTATLVGQCCQPNPVSQGQMHPDQHAFVALAIGNGTAWYGSDGGLVRSTNYSDISFLCAARGLGGSDLALCQQLLSTVPTHIDNLNAGLATLQFQSVSVASNNPFHVQGGTQDNGTFETFGSLSWPQIIYGDGGQSGFKNDNSAWRFNTFTGQANDGNFENADPTKWVEITGPILFSVEASQFYPPIIADPHPSFSGSIFQGSRHVWRSQDWGGATTIGIPVLEAFCPEFGPYNPGCGDFEPLGGASAFICDFVGTGCLNSGGDLGGTFYGTDRQATSASRLVSFVARTTSNTNTAWASTGGGRVFVSDNVNAASPPSVIWSRVDSTGTTAGQAANSPSRFPTSIAIDPNNVHHAWVSYSGYDFNTPFQPGHIFSVTWSGAGNASWTDISGNLPKIPCNYVVYDPFNGDLFAANDFIVLRLPAGGSVWYPAGTGMPFVEVSGLAFAPGAHILYAATHGRSVFRLNLP